MQRTFAATATAIALVLSVPAFAQDDVLGADQEGAFEEGSGMIEGDTGVLGEDEAPLGDEGTFQEGVFGDEGPLEGKADLLEDEGVLEDEGIVEDEGLLEEDEDIVGDDEGRIE